MMWRVFIVFSAAALVACESTPEPRDDSPPTGEGGGGAEEAPEPEAPPSDAPRDATLEATCVPWCAVEIDGVDAGKSPANIYVAAGTHAVVLRYPPQEAEVSREVEVVSGKGVTIGYDFNAGSWVGEAPGVEVPPGEETMVASGEPSASGQPELEVGCVPWCKVSVDGGEATTSPHASTYAAGEHTITLSYPPKSAEITKVITLEEGKRLKLTYNFNTGSWQ